MNLDGRIITMMDLLPDLLMLHESGWQRGEDPRPYLLRHYLTEHSRAGTFHDVPVAQEP